MNDILKYRLFFETSDYSILGTNEGEHVILLRKTGEIIDYMEYDITTEDVFEQIFMENFTYINVKYATTLLTEISLNGIMEYYFDKKVVEGIIKVLARNISDNN